MNVPELAFLFALYTLVVAAAVVVTIYVASRRRRDKLSALTVPKVASDNVRGFGRKGAAKRRTADRAATPRPEYESVNVIERDLGSLVNPPKRVGVPESAPAIAGPIEDQRSAETHSGRAPRRSAQLVSANGTARIDDVTVDGDIDSDAPSTLPVVAADQFAAVFTAGNALLPEGLRTLEVTPNRVIEPGTTIRAAFTFRNPGGAIASGFRARFSSPAGLVYTPGSSRIDDAPLDDAGAESPLLQAQGADIGDIAAGGERRVSLAFTVADTIENGTPITLQAAIASLDVPVIGSNIVRLIVRSRPVLQNAQTTLALVPVRAIVPGEDVVLTARVHNSGQSSAHDLVVLLPVPANTTFIAGSVTVDGKPFSDAAAQAAFGPGRPTIVTPVLEPRKSVEIGYRVRIDSPLDDATPIVAEATVCSQEVAEFALPPVGFSVPSAASFDGPATALSIACADEVEPGERLQIVLHAKNVGTAAARDLQLAIELPKQMLYVAGSLTIDGKHVPDRGTAPGAIALGDLGPARAVDLALTAIVQSPMTDGQRLRPTARVTWSKGERGFAREIVARSAPRFPADFNTIERESPPRARPNDAVAYTIALANMGTDVATNVRVKLAADPGLEALRVREGDADIALGADLTFSVGALEPGFSRLLRISGRIAGIVEDQRQLRLTATLLTAQLAPVELGVQTHVIESRPNFSVLTSRLRADNTQALRFKRVDSYRLVLSNEGTDCGRDMRVTLALPDELRLVSVDGSEHEGTTIDFGDIPAGERREVRLAVQLVGIIAGGEPLTIGGRVSGINVVPFNLTSLELATHAEASFAEGARLTSEPANWIDAGDALTYTLTLRNSGDGAAKHLTSRITMLTNAVYAQGSTTVNGVALQDHAGTSLLLSDGGLRLADIGAGVEIVASWRVIVKMPLPPGTTVESAVAIQWDNAPECIVTAEPVDVESHSALPIMDPVLPFSVLGAIAARSPR